MAEGYKPPQMNRKAFIYLGVLVGLGGLMLYFSIFYPLVFAAILNFFWVLMLIAVTIFLVLGFLVIVGLKDEVSSFLDVMLEGSLTILDAVEFLKQLYEKFIALLKDFIYYIAPLLASLVAGALYIGILVLYKSVGRENDVTLMTAILTVGMVIAVGVLNRPTEPTPIDTWLKAVRERFKLVFVDAFEVVIFIFFLTMDATSLFFLPASLNVPLEASVGDYNLMLRGADVSHQLTATIYLITIGITIEIVRNLVRIVAVAIEYYKDMPRDQNRNDNIKKSIRLSFTDAKDDLVKFITFTTTLILVFLLFPRLKLFAMLITSVAGLFMDILIPARLRVKRSNDLISRILNRTFNL